MQHAEDSITARALTVITTIPSSGRETKRRVLGEKTGQRISLWRTHQVTTMGALAEAMHVTEPL